MTRVRLASITPSAANSVRRRFPLVFAAALVALAITLLGSNAPLFAQEPPPDDYTMDDLFEGGTWGVLSVGESISGNIEEPGDVDFFAVDLAKGNTYRFEMSGSGDTSLSEPRLSGVYLYAVEFECSGAYDDPAVQAYSLIAGESTTYGAGVRADGDGVGGYTLTVTESDETDTGCDTVQPGAEPEQVENTPATGEPTISGAAQVGETLTADVSGIADADGLVNATFSYQWLADDSEVSGAMDSSYALVDADEGKAISVTVTFTDDAGNEESLTGAATDAVAAVPATNTPATGTPTISGTAQVGETLTADTSAIADEDGLTDASFAYQWVADGADISGATSDAYTLIDADEGNTISVTVTFTDDAGNDESLTGAATAAVAPKPNSPATGAPAITGTAQVGETLTADTSAITDEDGLDKATFSYQWIAGGVEIAGATGSTYTLTSADEGKAISVKVSFTDDGGHAESLTGAATDAVAATTSEANADETAEPTDRPHNLTAAASDGAVVLTWKKPVGVRYISDYRILRHRPELGETEPLVYVEWTYTPDTTYTDTDVELGVLYVYTVQAVNFLGDLSEASYPVEIRATATATDPEPEPVENSPATGAPAISGTAQVGETLTADTSGIEDEDGLDNVTYSYQWVADGADVSGATNDAYTLVESDEGSAISVTVTFTDDAGNDESLTSVTTDAVESLEPDLFVVGIISVTNPSGTYPGDTFTLGSAVRNVGNGPSPATTLRYYQSTDKTVDASDTEVATVAVAELAPSASSDGGVYVTAPPPPGTYYYGACVDAVAGESDTTNNCSGSIRIEVLAWNSAPTGFPTISGTARVGKTLTADVSGIADSDGLTNVAYSYQWLSSRDTEIDGATSSTYTLQASDEGKIIKVRVSFTDDGGNDESLTSDATDVVAADPEPEPVENTPATGAPAISGTVQVGETLTADVSGITDDDGLTNATFSYQWIVNEETGDADSTGASYTVVVADDGSTAWVPVDGTADTDIEGATGASYTLTDAEEGRPVRVRVSYTDDAGNEETLISAPTLMASIHDAPSSHDGETDFTFELRFSEELPLSYKTLRDHAFTVTGGTVKKAKRMEQGSNIGWRITVRPDSSGAVTIILPVTEDCDAQGAICTEDGRMLSTRLELTVSGP